MIYYANIDSCAYRAFSLASLSKLHPYRSAEKLFYQNFTFSLLWPSINVSFRHKLLLYLMIISDESSVVSDADAVVDSGDKILYSLQLTAYSIHQFLLFYYFEV